MHAARIKSANEIPARGRDRRPRERGPRDAGLDVAKGFCIVIVVFGQALSGLMVENFFPPNVLWPPLAVYVLYAFAVPLFFVVSGVLAAGKHLPAGVVMGRAVARLAWPCLLWSAAAWSADWYFHGHNMAALPQLWRILWAPVSPYWFLYALFFVQLLFLATRRWKPAWQVALAAGIFAASLYGGPLALRIFGLKLLGLEPFGLKLSLGIVVQVTRGFLFFTLGALAAGGIAELGIWAGVLTTLLFAALAVAYYQMQVSGPSGPIVLVLVSVSGIVAVLGWSRALVGARGVLAERVARPIAGLVGFFGRYSMGILVMHLFFTAGVRILLRRYAGNPVGMGIGLEIAAATVAGVLGPLGVNWVASRVKVDRWLGLQRMGAE